MKIKLSGAKKQKKQKLIGTDRVRRVLDDIGHRNRKRDQAICRLETADRIGKTVECRLWTVNC